MNHRRHGFKAFMLAIMAALGLMAFTAAGAQAGQGEWLINTINGVKTLKELGGLESITGEEEGKGSLLILKLNLSLTCNETEVVNAHIVSSPLGHAKGTIEFSDCEVLDSKGEPNEACVLHEPIVAEALALIIKHGGTGYLLFAPAKEGAPFATVKALDKEEEGECLLPDEAEVKGSVVAEIKVKDQVNMLISTKLTLILFPNHKLFYGNHEAHLFVDALIRLTGPHLGRAWGYHLL
jgi:hypothetical protein